MEINIGRYTKLFSWMNIFLLFILWTANKLERIHAINISCPQAPKCHALMGLVWCSHAVAECIGHKCICNKAGYNPCTCTPTVGSCTITSDTVNARATATYLGDDKPRYSCTPSDYNPRYNVHVISNFASNDPASSRHGQTAGDATVSLRKEGGHDGRPIILLLVSHQPNRWTLDISKNVQLEKVILVSYYLDRTSVIVEKNASIKNIERQNQVQCGHGDDESSGNTPKLLSYIQRRFGSIASFTGSYRVDTWDLTIISQGDSGRDWFIPVRLVNGSNYMEGRVEVYINNKWGTVCDDKWDLTEANVVCRQFGYHGPSSAFKGPQFGSGNDESNIWLDNVQCQGDEQNIGRCTYNMIGSHDCDHLEDAGVVCTMGNEREPDIPIRLAGGDVANEGRVELYYDGAWGTACARYWTKVDGTVVCKQLGYFFASEVTISTRRFGEGKGPIFLHNIRCDGSESDLFECQHDNIGEHTCTHAYDAGVVCAKSPPDEMQVRLMHGESTDEGQVQVKYFGSWLPICGEHGWDLRDARVVCHQLDFGEAVIGYSEEGPSGYVDEMEDDRTRPIITIDRMSCHGNETNIAQCKYEVQFTQRCRYGAQVTCRTPKSGHLGKSSGMTVTSPMFWVCLGIGLLLLALIVFMFACFFMRRAPARPIDRTPALSAIVTSATRASIPMVGPAASESLDSVWVPRHQLSRIDKPYHNTFLGQKRHAGKPSYLTAQYMPPRTTLTRPVEPETSRSSEIT
ncbi:uncharacterized protein [Amphiura filiformis]|uniref:uncharacterized protein n=1 Tax=Amphiura filiformis TaxID=82378 RepID=UPI003B21B8ED